MSRFLLTLLACLAFCSCREAVEEEADEKFAAAESALRAGEWDAADESFYETILLDPDRADAWIGRGMTLTRLGEIEGARSHYEEALSIYREGRDPEAPEEAHALLHKEIMLLVLLGREQEAREIAGDAGAETAAHQQRLLELIDQLRAEFSDMILPPISEDTVPLMDEDPQEAKL